MNGLGSCKHGLVLVDRNFCSADFDFYSGEGGLLSLAFKSKFNFAKSDQSALSGVHQTRQQWTLVILAKHS